MKVDGITLLQMINGRAINKKTKIYIDYKVTHNRERMENEIEYLIYENGNLFTNGNRVKIWDCMGIEYFLDHNFKIIEEEEKPIKEVKEIRELIELSFSKLEEAQDKINRLENELEKRGNK